MKNCNHDFSPFVRNEDGSIESIFTRANRNKRIPNLIGEYPIAQQPRDSLGRFSFKPKQTEIAKDLVSRLQSERRE